MERNLNGIKLIVIRLLTKIMKSSLTALIETKNMASNNTTRTKETI
jgi:hypothetical protein